jgi:hypothetical protein
MTTESSELTRNTMLGGLSENSEIAQSINFKLPDIPNIETIPDETGLLNVNVDIHDTQEVAGNTEIAGSRERVDLVDAHIPGARGVEIHMQEVAGDAVAEATSKTADSVSAYTQKGQEVADSKMAEDASSMELATLHGWPWDGSKKRR